MQKKTRSGMDHDAKNRKMRNVVVLQGYGDNKDFAIDEDDYGVVREIILHFKKGKAKDTFDRTFYRDLFDFDE